MVALMMLLIVSLWLGCALFKYKISRNISLAPHISDLPKRAYSRAEIAARCFGFWQNQQLQSGNAEQMSKVLINTVNAFGELKRCNAHFAAPKVDMPIDECLAYYANMLDDEYNKTASVNHAPGHHANRVKNPLPTAPLPENVVRLPVKDDGDE